MYVMQYDWRSRAEMRRLIIGVLKRSKWALFESVSRGRVCTLTITWCTPQRRRAIRSKWRIYKLCRDSRGLPIVQAVQLRIRAITINTINSANAVNGFLFIFLVHIIRGSPAGKLLDPVGPQCRIDNNWLSWNSQRQIHGGYSFVNITNITTRTRPTRFVVFAFKPKAYNRSASRYTSFWNIF